MIPYDAKDAGEFIGDASRPLFGLVGGVIQLGHSGPFGIRAHSVAVAPQAGGYGVVHLDFDVSRVWPVSSEFRSASLSANYYIAY